jgi:hypothetical protein
MTTRPHRRRLAALGRAAAIAAVLVVAACDEPPPATPTSGGLQPVLIEGAWVGVLADGAAGVGELQLSATGYDRTPIGSFTLQLRGRPAPLRGGIAGIIRGPADVVLYFTIEPTDAECPGVGTMYRAQLALAGNRLTGTIDPIIPCPLLRGGTIELTRR